MSGKVDVTDTENCLASPNIYSVAEERGWWKPGEILDFTKVYGNGEYQGRGFKNRAYRIPMENQTNYWGNIKCGV